MNGLWFFVLGLVAGPILIFGLLALLGRRGKTIEARDADVALGRSEVEQELPAGWTIVEADFESFSAGDRELDVWGAFAEGPAGEVTVAVARTEADAYRQLARALRGDLEVSDGWAPPMKTGEKGQL